MAELDELVKPPESTPSFSDKLMQTWPAKMAQSMLGAAALPGDVYAGRVLPESPEYYNRATDLAGLVTGGSFAAPAQKNAVGAGIRGYHGSPHDFDRFSLAHIGKGEGHQAYGYGTYIAEAEPTAIFYRDALSPINKAQRGVSYAESAVKAFGGDKQKAIASLEDELRNRIAGHDSPAMIPNVEFALKFLKGDPSVYGRMYQVNINAKPHQFLDWDNPLHLQPNEIQRAANIYSEVDPAMRGMDVYRHYAKLFGGGEGASNTLLDAGIPGLRYLDSGSRGRSIATLNPQIANYEKRLSAGDLSDFERRDFARALSDLRAERDRVANGTSNYVVFNPDLIDIVRKYAAPGAIGTAATYQATKPQLDQLTEGMPSGNLQTSMP